VGPYPVVVVEAAQRNEAPHVQRAGRNGCHKADVSIGVQAQSLPDPGVWLLRMAGHAGGKQPWYFTARDGSPALTVAGLWDEWHDKASGETLKSCTMIITEPNKFVAEVHDRMPVLLVEKDYEPWLSGKAGLALLKPAAENVLQKWPVSKRVNSSRAPDDDPTLIDKVAI
jgi:putative SOS response-associated peptidase YedK